MFALSRKKNRETLRQAVPMGAFLYTPDRSARLVGPSVRRSVGPAFAKKVIFSEGNDLKVIFLEGNDLKVKFSEGNDLKVIHTERNDLKVILSVK